MQLLPAPAVYAVVTAAAEARGVLVHPPVPRQQHQGVYPDPDSPSFLSFELRGMNQYFLFTWMKDQTIF